MDHSLHTQPLNDRLSTTDDEITRHLVNRFQQHKLYHQVGERVLISLNPGNIYGEENAAASTDLPEDRESLYVLAILFQSSESWTPTPVY